MKKLEDRLPKFYFEKIIFCSVFILNTFISFWMIEIMQKLIDSAVDINKIEFLKNVKLFLIGILLNILFIVLDQVFFRKIINYGNMNLKKYTYRNYLKNCKITNNNASEFVSKFNSDLNIVSYWLSIGKINTFVQIMILILYLGVMFKYNFEITIFVIFIISLIFLFARFFSVKESKFTSEFQRLLQNISSKLYNSFLNIFTIMQLNKQKYFVNCLKSVHLENSSIIKGLSKYKSLGESMLTLMVDILPLITFVIGILFVKLDRMTFGTSFAIMLIVQKLNEPIIVLAELLSDKKNGEEVYNRISALFLNENINGDTYFEVINPFKKFDIKINKYSYGDSGNDILRNTFLSIRRGDLLIIKGESGKGKTTLLKLISKFLDEKGLDGKILYNDFEISKYKNLDYYKHVLQVEQNSMLIEGTLKENIFIGDNFLHEDFEKIIYTCVLEKFLENKEDNFVIKEHGKNISGGEKQRIGLARILIRKPEVLILDEITSGLDQETKKELIERLVKFKEKYNITLIVVSHDECFDGFKIVYKNL